MGMALSYCERRRITKSAVELFTCVSCNNRTPSLPIHPLDSNAHSVITSVPPGSRSTATQCLVIYLPQCLWTTNSISTNFCEPDCKNYLWVLINQIYQLMWHLWQLPSKQSICDQTKLPFLWGHMFSVILLCDVNLALNGLQLWLAIFH